MVVVRPPDYLVIFRSVKEKMLQLVCNYLAGAHKKDVIQERIHGFILC